MPSLLSDAQLTQILRKAAGVAFRLDQETARAKDKPQLSLLLDARLTVNDLLALVDQLRQQRDELKEFVDRCRELGATDTDIVKHALEDQERIRTELAPLSIRLEDHLASCSRLRRALEEVQAKLERRWGKQDVDGSLIVIRDTLAALSVRDDGPQTAEKTEEKAL